MEDSCAPERALFIPGASLIDLCRVNPLLSKAPYDPVTFVSPRTKAGKNEHLISF